MKKILFLAVFGLIFSGCDLDKDIDEPTAEEVLVGQKVYDLSGVNSKYIVYEFSNFEVTKYIYSDKELEDLEDIQKYKIEYKDDEVDIITPEHYYKCEVDTLEDDEYINLTCEAEDGTLISISGWTNEYDALISGN